MPRNGFQFSHGNLFEHIALGAIPGAEQWFLVGRIKGIQTVDTAFTIWDTPEHRHTPLSANTGLFVSSSSASDTAVSVLVTGTDANYNQQSLLVTVDGQSQVSIGSFTSITLAVVVGPTAPVGSLYIAEADTLTAGKPNTTAKVHSKILAGSNVTRNGFVTVPAGKMAAVIGQYGSTNTPDKPARIQVCFTPFGGVSTEFFEYDIAGGLVRFNHPSPVAHITLNGMRFPAIDEKTYIEFATKVAVSGTDVFFGADLLFIPKEYLIA